MRSLSQNTLAELKSSKYPKEDVHLLQKSQTMKTDENATQRILHVILYRLFK